MAYSKVTDLETQSLEQLREVWRQQFGAPPKLRSTPLLRSLLAWRLQALTLGSIDYETRKSLRRKKAKPVDGIDLGIGAKIIKEWRGQKEEIIVEEAGFRWRDQSYRSLSAIARDMTGVRRNGPRFFGLREDPKPQV